MLIRGYDINEWEESGKHPIDFAKSHEQMKIVELLMIHDEQMKKINSEDDMGHIDGSIQLTGNEHSSIDIDIRKRWFFFVNKNYLRELSSSPLIFWLG